MQEEPEIERVERETMLESIKQNAEEFPIMASLLAQKMPNARQEFRERAFEAGLDVIIKGLEATLAK
jgi:hypothetical protein